MNGDNMLSPPPHYSSFSLTYNLEIFRKLNVTIILLPNRIFIVIVSYIIAGHGDSVDLVNW